MRITIVVAVLISAAIFFSSCNLALAQFDTTTSASLDEEAKRIGYSKIHPATPLYFLKTLRESLEIKLAGTNHAKVIRYIEFSKRRLREVNRLILENHQDKIQQNLERYWFQIERQRDFAKDSELQAKVSQSITQDLPILLSFYDQLTDPKAKMGVRTALNRLYQRRLELGEGQPAYFAHLLTCQLFSKEASSSALSEAERAILAERAQVCFQKYKDQKT